MRYGRMILVGLLALLGGCAVGSSPSTSSAFTPQADCERNSAVWHATMNYCEYPKP
jgi:hypothetical protein